MPRSDPTMSTLCIGLASKQRLAAAEAAMEKIGNQYLPIDVQ